MAAIARAQNETMLHRGPDSGDIYLDHEAGLALAHRRLAILDLSPSGHQPMVSSCGRFAMVCNGEIYNHAELRKDLSGYPFRGHSDTEVAVAAIQRWGVRGALTRFVGMFAFGVWDSNDRVLYLVRDRLGEKPLYFGRLKRGLVFGSELQALCAHPDWDGRVDRDSLTLLLRYGYIPAPRSIYQGIGKVMPGSVVTIRTDRPHPDIQQETYWSAAKVVLNGIETRRTGDPRDAVDELDVLLNTTIIDKMAADVPLGAFLSGGIDSSAIAAIMQRQSVQAVRTFSIGFHESEYNEAHYARAVAKHIGTDHTELYVTPEETRAVIPRLPTLYDEPFADPSQIPTCLIAALARRDVTVALSGDAGDELFGGYTRYFVGGRLWRGMERIPLPVRAAAGALIRGTPPGVFDAAMAAVRPMMPRRWRYQHAGQKLHKLARVWNAASHDAIYAMLVSLIDEPSKIVIGSREPDGLGRHRSTLNEIGGFTDRMMFADLVTYLPDDILVKVDRASMGVGLEVRVPFLDHRIVEFAWQQPVSLKILGNQGKWLLRQVLRKYVPDKLIDRPKMGFGVPIEHWLRGPLREWAEALLDANRLRREGFFEPKPVRDKWDAHQSGNRAMQYELWPILMFQAWAEQYMH